MKKFVWIVGILLLVQFVIAGEFIDNLRLDTNTISSTNTDGDLVLDPNGTGDVNVSTSKIINVTDPTGPQEAATKNYTDITFLPFAGGTLTGTFTITDGSEGSSGDVWTSSDAIGSGAWAAPAGAGANTALSNLSGVSVNADLIPGSTNLDLGSASAEWAQIHLKSLSGISPFTVYDNSDEDILIIDGDMTTPSGTTNGAHIKNPMMTGDIDLNIYTADTSAASGVGGTLRLESGNASAGTTNSGPIDIQTGTSAGGSRGFINLLSGGVITDANISPASDDTVDLGTAFVNYRIIYGRLFLGNNATPIFGSDFNTALNSNFETGSSNTAAATGNLLLHSGDQLAVGSGTIGTVTLKSGDILEATNANDTGDVFIESGTTAGAGARGTINLLDGSEGISGECWVSTGTGGEGNWETCPAASVVNPEAGGVRMVSAYIQQPAGVPTVARQDGSWISSLTDNATGNVTVNFTGSTFSAPPNCVCTAGDGTNAMECYIDENTSATSSLVRIETTQSASGSAFDATFTIICVGNQ